MPYAATYIIIMSYKSNYDFDKIIDRKSTHSEKWDKYGDRDVIPLWVADMDFASPPAIVEALREVTEKEVFGYAHVPDELNDVIIERLKTRHNWDVKREWLVWLPGLVPGIYTSCRAVGQDGDAVMTATPIYGHFYLGPQHSNREVQKIPMKVDEAGVHTLDFDAIRAAITPKTKMFILCNPHNPNGRVYTKTELEELAQICIENNIVICSDEIHCDLILDETKRHISIGTISQEIENQSITLLAPSKTFNIAGLGCSLAVIPNEEIRKNFNRAKFGILPPVNCYAGVAALAAYKHGEEWRLQLMDYLRGNHELVLNEINSIKGLKMAPLEATYLAWIDVRESETKNIVSVLEEAGVGVMDASMFGSEGFIRLNFGTQQSLLEEALRRMKKALS